MRAAPLLLLAAVPLAGCALPFGTGAGDCPLVVLVEQRAIDEGFRYDVATMQVDPLGLDEVRYRLSNHSGPAPVRVHEGNLLDLADRGPGNGTLRFLDADPKALLNRGDAFVLREPAPLNLQLSRDGNIIGGTMRCA